MKKSWDYNCAYQVVGTIEITILCTKFLAPLLRIVRVWTTDGSFCCLDWVILFYLSAFYVYLSFNYHNSITIWIYLTEIYKMTIACIKLTISVGSTLTHVRFITWTTQCTCWLVVRSCDKELRLQLCVPCWWRHWWSQFRAPCFWRRCRGLFEFGQLTVHLVAQIR